MTDLSQPRAAPVNRMKDAPEPMVRGFAMRMYSLMQRAMMSSRLGITFGGKRDMYEAFGWPRSISEQEIWDMYRRGGIARRVVRAYPVATWGRPPQLYNPADAAWTADADRFAKAVDLWPALGSLDVLCGLGRYAVLVIGADKGLLSAPRKKGTRITFLKAYAEKNIKIQKWDTDARSPTFGKPLVYRVTPSRVDTTGSRTIQDVPPVQAPFDVHASHCIHVAREADEDGIFGIPYYVPIWNDLIDLMKVVGSSAESYWRTAYQGLHADVDKELDMDPDDEKNLSEELDEYQHNLRRTIRTRGVTVKSLGTAVADPSGAFNTLLTMIAGSTGIPKRILVGSEAGQLASTQDRGNWAERVEDYRTTHAVPNILWPLLRWLNEHEVYTMDVNAIKLLWPSAYRQSPMEQAQTGAQTARTLANVQKGLQPIILEEAVPATTDALGKVTSEAKPAVTAEPLLSRDEARRLLGLSTDQQLLAQTPDNVNTLG